MHMEVLSNSIFEDGGCRVIWLLMGTQPQWRRGSCNEAISILRALHKMVSRWSHGQVLKSIPRERVPFFLEKGVLHSSASRVARHRNDGPSRRLASEVAFWLKAQPKRS